MARKSLLQPIETFGTQRAPCGWPDCNDPMGAVKLHTPTGTLDVCLRHYDQYWLATPKSPSDPSGLKDQTEMTRRTFENGYRARWCKDRGLPLTAAKRGNIKLPRLREPGDDDEEIAA